MSHTRTRLSVDQQAGMSLLSVLVAILVFSLGMLSLASIYGLAVPAQTANQEATDTAAFGNQFWALLQANPGLVAQIGTPSATVQYTSTTGAPTALQPLLNNIFSNSQSLLPNASVSITTGPGADGNPCTTVVSPPSALCGVTLVITWNPTNKANGLRTQTFNYQVGF